MRILIVEDEIPAANKLSKLIREVSSEDVEIVDIIDSVEESVILLNKTKDLDIVFFDIRLSDGLSFEILEQVDINTNIIFTTAYDEYAVKAFRANAIDYLLKPIDKLELKEAIRKAKYKTLAHSGLEGLLEQYKNTQTKNYKERFLIKLGPQLKFVKTEDISYFVSEDSLSFIVTTSGSKFVMDDSMDKIEQQLNQAYFFRINRKFIVSINAINKILAYSNSRLKIELIPMYNKELIVARERVKEFKNWLGR